MPTPLYHFTSLHHLASLIEHGLLCDNSTAVGLLAVEVGNRRIKEQRRRRAVPVDPRGRSWLVLVRVLRYERSVVGTSAEGGAVIHKSHGNLLDSDAEALVNTVNTVGVMGKGIALQFTKGHWRAHSRLPDIEAGLADLVRVVREKSWAVGGGLVVPGPTVAGDSCVAVG